jgi:colanic acid biosynthesis glycosyl transferase WcaI
MRILLYGTNYAPELTGIGKYTGEMATWLAARGHDVHVLTAMPYYPEWQVHPKYKGKVWHTEQLEGVKVHRVPLYVPGEVSAIKRIVHECSFLFSSAPFWFGFLFKKKFDVVFCMAPPFHLSLAPWIYNFFKPGVWINHIQDLQVDAAKDLGMIKNKRFLDIMFSLERFFLKKGTCVSTISEGMSKKILNKGIVAENMLFFPNWVDSEVIFPLSKEESLRQEMGFSQQDQVILYSGNLGEKQGLDAIIRIAKTFTSQTEVKFVICGTGGAKEKLMQQAASAELQNVFFFPLQPYEKLSALLAIADLHLVLQKGSAADLVMPSKLTGILAAGGCALVTALPGTTLYEVIKEHDMGILVSPDDEQALRDGIARGLQSDSSHIKQRARDYAEQYLDKNQILQTLEGTLRELIQERNTERLIDYKKA